MAVQLCVFDMGRGQVEGQELDKILFFWPSNCPLSSQLSVVGLSEGLITFTRIFSPQAPCELMEAEQHTHVFYQCEPQIWMVMVVEKSKENDDLPRYGAILAILKEAHNLFTLFYGSLQSLLQAHPAGDVARNCLGALLPDFLSDFSAGKKFCLPTITESLKDRGTVQVLFPQVETRLEAQCLEELLKSWFGGGTVDHVLILFQNLLVSSTLPVADTTNLFLYATQRMMPSMLSSVSAARSYPQKDYPAAEVFRPSIVAPASSIRPSNLQTLSHSNSGNYSSEGGTETVDPASREQDFKHNVPTPLKRDGWWQSGDGFLETHVWDAHEGKLAVLPTIWLNELQQRMYFCVYQHKSVTLIVLIPISNGPEAVFKLKAQILEKAVQKIEKLEDKLVKEWPGTNAWHVAGYRYLFCDSSNKMSRSSPPSKVATLSMESFAALNRIREEVDIGKARAERQGVEPDTELELCVRTKQNTWIIVRIQSGYELYTVLERASQTLLLVCDAVEKLSQRYFNGLFNSD